MSPVTGTHGLEDFLGRGRTVLMLDIDDDNDMDALIVNLDRQFLGGTPGDADNPEDDPSILRPSELYLNDGTGSFTPVADPNGVISDESIRYAHLTSTGPGLDPVLITSNSFVFGLDTINTGSATLSAATNPVVQSLGVDDNATRIRDIALGDLDGDLIPDAVFARQDDFLSTDEEDTDNDPATPGPGDGMPDLEGQLPISTRQVSTGANTTDVLAAISADPLVDNCRSVALADFDNDADLDIFGGCTMVETGQDQNVILLNDGAGNFTIGGTCLLYTSPSPRDATLSRMPSSA